MIKAEIVTSISTSAVLLEGIIYIVVGHSSTYHVILAILDRKRETVFLPIKTAL